MRAFVSWSGGKDCMFAMHNFLKNSNNQVVCLVHFAQEEYQESNSHRIEKELMISQALSLDIPLIQEIIGAHSYKHHLINVIERLKKDGVTSGVFGDIYLEEHRNWIEEICTETGISACFPLWGRSTAEVVSSFVKEGFKAHIIAIKDQIELHPFIGKQLDSHTAEIFCNLSGIDPCGENGEYHTFVFDGPCFSHPVTFRTAEQTQKLDNRIFQPISHV